MSIAPTASTDRVVLDRRVPPLGGFNLTYLVIELKYVDARDRARVDRVLRQRPGCAESGPDSVGLRRRASGAESGLDTAPGSR